MPLYQQKAIKTGRTEHQDTKLTSMRPRLKDLNDNPYIAVRQDLRGGNIGGDLVNEIAEWAKRQDMAGCLFLTVNALHTKEYSAVRFYEKCKFAKLTPISQMDVWPMFKTLWV